MKCRWGIRAALFVTLMVVQGCASASSFRTVTLRAPTSDPGTHAWTEGEWLYIRKRFEGLAGSRGDQGNYRFHGNIGSKHNPGMSWKGYQDCVFNAGNVVAINITTCFVNRGLMVKLWTYCGTLTSDGKPNWLNNRGVLQEPNVYYSTELPNPQTGVKEKHPNIPIWIDNRGLPHVDGSRRNEVDHSC